MPSLQGRVPGPFGLGLSSFGPPDLDPTPDLERLEAAPEEKASLIVAHGTLGKARFVFSFECTFDVEFKRRDRERKPHVRLFCVRWLCVFVSCFRECHVACLRKSTKKYLSLFVTQALLATALGLPEQAKTCEDHLGGMGMWWLVVFRLLSFNLVVFFLFVGHKFRPFATLRSRMARSWRRHRWTILDGLRT